MTGSGLIFKKVTKKHVGDVFALEKACFAHPWTYNMFYTDICENDITEYIIAEIDGVHVGYGGMWIILDEAHITNICTHPNFRRRGIASMLLSKLMSIAASKGADRMTLEVRVSNVAAMKLYESMGFHVCGKRNCYYSDNGEDAYILWVEGLCKNKEL